LRYRGLLDGIGEDARLRVSDAAGAVTERRRLPGGADHERALAAVLEWLQANLGDLALIAAGHRVVHGGPAHSAPALVDAGLLGGLQDQCALAPLHHAHCPAAVPSIRPPRPPPPPVASSGTPLP